MPIVHGLEKQFAGRLVLYLHVGEPRTSDAKARLGFKSTQHIVLLRADGTKVHAFIGVAEERALREAPDELAPRRAR
jgi:hypothetical protein